MSGAKSFGILIDPGGGVGGTDRVIGLALSITRDLSRLAVDDGDLSRLPRRAVGRAADHVRSALSFPCSFPVTSLLTPCSVPVPNSKRNLQAPRNQGVASLPEQNAEIFPVIFPVSREFRAHIFPVHGNEQADELRPLESWWTKKETYSSSSTTSPRAALAWVTIFSCCKAGTKS